MSGVNPGGYREAAARSLREEPDVRASVGSATRTFDTHRVRAFSQIDADRWRDWARDVKSHTLTHLDRYLEQATERLEANGVHVHWAETAGDALGVLDDVVERHGVRTAVKGKSMLSEELEVNAHLERLGVDPVETDLGEYIIQMLGEPPSHIVGPAIHKSLDACRKLFHERLGTPLDGSPDTLADDPCNAAPGFLENWSIGDTIGLDNDGDGLYDGADPDCVGDCPSDITGDGIVGTPDLLQLLANWGPCPGCPEDLTGDGVVGTPDLLQLLADWGPC